MKIIYVLLAVICASQLFSMNPTIPRRPLPKTPINYIESLPKDIQILVIQALNTGDNADEKIRAITALSQTNKALNKIIKEVYYDNLKGFTALVHMLAAKLDTNAHEIIEKLGETAASKEYKKLVMDLYQALDKNDIMKANLAVTQGADVHTSYADILGGPKNLLSSFVERNNLEAVKFLLEQGLNPKYNRAIYENIMRWLKHVIKIGMNPDRYTTDKHRTPEETERAKSIRTLIEQAAIDNERK